MRINNILKNMYLLSHAAALSFLIPEAIRSQDILQYQYLAVSTNFSNILENILDLRIGYETSLIFKIYNYLVYQFLFDKYIYVAPIIILYMIMAALLRYMAFVDIILLSFTMPIFILYGYAHRQALSIFIFLIIFNKRNLVYDILVPVFAHPSYLIGAALSRNADVKFLKRFAGAFLGFLLAIFIINFGNYYGAPENKSLSYIALLNTFFVWLSLFSLSVKTRNFSIYLVGSLLLTLTTYGLDDGLIYRILPWIFIFGMAAGRRLNIFHRISLIGSSILGVVFLLRDVFGEFAF